MANVIELAGARRKRLDEHEERVYGDNLAEVVRAGWEDIYPVTCLEQFDGWLENWYGQTGLSTTYRIKYDETTGTFWFYSTYRAAVDLIKSGELIGPNLDLNSRDVSAMLSMRWINPDFVRARNGHPGRTEESYRYHLGVRGFYHEDTDVSGTMELDLLVTQLVSRLMVLGYAFEEPVVINGPVEGFVGEKLLFFRATLDNEIFEFYLDGHTAVAEAQALIAAEEEKEALEKKNEDG